MKKNILYLGVALLLVVLCFSSCKKDFLDAKPNSAILAPKTIADFQGLLDNYSIINRTSALGLLSCDDYFIYNEQEWSSLSPTQRNSYIWSKDIFGGETGRTDWSYPFQSIFYANSVLSGLNNLSADLKQGKSYNGIKGQALFIRAFNFFDLAKNFCATFDKSTIATDLGLPLKLSPEIDILLPRSTLKQTYQQIILDLSTAIPLLDQSVPAVYRNRPSKPAGYALFARLYLTIRDYENAEKYADSCLSLYSNLIDYNTISTTSNSPFSVTNEETLMNALLAPVDYNSIFYNTDVKISVDSNLFNSYDENDLRKAIFFNVDTANRLIKVKRGYSRNTYSFVGLSTDEIYLIKSECLARRNNLSEAVSFLNKLLEKRFKAGEYVPYIAKSKVETLSKILLERRKELIWRGGTRWDDIRRLNKEGAGILLTRKLGGKIYTLEPNSPKYTFPIPADEIALSGIQQNIR